MEFILPDSKTEICFDDFNMDQAKELMLLKECDIDLNYVMTINPERKFVITRVEEIVS